MKCVVCIVNSMKCVVCIVYSVQCIVCPMNSRHCAHDLCGTWLKRFVPVGSLDSICLSRTYLGHKWLYRTELYWNEPCNYCHHSSLIIVIIAFSRYVQLSGPPPGPVNRCAVHSCSVQFSSEKYFLAQHSLLTTWPSCWTQPYQPESYKEQPGWYLELKLHQHFQGS